MPSMTVTSEVEVRRPGIPYAWYMDETIHQIEQDRIFSQHPQYIGHELMVPKVGDYYVSEASRGRYVLVRSDEGVEVFENICPHGNLTLMSGRGNVKKIVCPIHRWVYDRDGHLCAAPGFDPTPCLGLRKIPLCRWNGMLFESDVDINAQLEPLTAFDELNFEGYEFDNATVEHLPFNWKIFLEICQENYHLKSVHPGLNHFVDANTLQWYFGENYTLQTLEPLSAFRRPATPVYHEYHRQLRQLCGDDLPQHAGVWAYIYPDINLEWYPFSLIINRVIPCSATQIINVTESYYRSDIRAEAPQFIVAEQAARNETGQEDDVVCRRMHDARLRAYETTTPPTDEIYHRSLEAGRLWFHDRLRSDLSAYCDVGE